MTNQFPLVITTTWSTLRKKGTLNLINKGFRLWLRRLSIFFSKPKNDIFIAAS